MGTASSKLLEPSPAFQSRIPISSSSNIEESQTCSLESPDDIAKLMTKLARSVHIFQQSALDIAKFASLRVHAFDAWEVVTEREMELQIQGPHDSLDAMLEANKQLLSFCFQQAEKLQRLRSHLEPVNLLFELCANKDVQHVYWSDRIKVAFLLSWIIITNDEELVNAIGDGPLKKRSAIFVRAVEYDVIELDRIMDEHESVMAEKLTTVKATPDLLKKFDSIYKDLLSRCSQGIQLSSQLDQTPSLSVLKDLAVDRFPWLREAEPLFLLHDAELDAETSTVVGSHYLSTQDPMPEDDEAGQNLFHRPFLSVDYTFQFLVERLYRHGFQVIGTVMEVRSSRHEVLWGATIRFSVQEQGALVPKARPTTPYQEFYGEGATRASAKNDTARSVLKHHREWSYDEAVSLLRTGITKSNTSVSEQKARFSFQPRQPPMQRQQMASAHTTDTLAVASTSAYTPPQPSPLGTSNLVPLPEDQGSQDQKDESSLPTYPAEFDLTGKIKLGRRVRAGTGSELYQSEIPGDPVPVKVVVKQILAQGDEGKVRERCLKRFTASRSFQHPNIVPVLGFLIGYPKYGLVLPEHEAGSVIDYAKKLGQGTTEIRMGLIQDISAGIEYLHSIPVVHGDIRGENVWVDDQGIARLVKLGVSVSAKDSVTIDGEVLDLTLSGYHRFMAPELLDEGVPTNESDVWAFGCLASQILTDRLPYHQYDRMGPLYKAVKRGEAPEANGEIVAGRPLWEVISGCWALSPQYRPVMSQISEMLKQF